MSSGVEVPRRVAIEVERAEPARAVPQREREDRPQDPVTADTPNSGKRCRPGSGTEMLRQGHGPHAGPVPKLGLKPLDRSADSIRCRDVLRRLARRSRIPRLP